MSVKQQVKTDQAPDLMPDVLSQAIISNSTVYCSGAVGIDPKTNKLVSGTVADRTHQCLLNLSAVLHSAKSSLAHVLKVNVFLSDMGDFGAMNEVYKTYWPEGSPKPARTCVAAKQLPLGTDVEIECVAAVPARGSKL